MKIFQILSIIIIYCISAAYSINYNNYAFSPIDKFNLKFYAKIQNFYMPNSQTILIKTTSYPYYIKMINIKQSALSTNLIDSYAKNYFGNRLTLINLNSTSTKISKSYQYPNKKIENIHRSKNSIMNSILWINISTAIVSINYDSYKYLGIYNINSDVLDEKRIDGYEYKFINTIKLQGNDIVDISTQNSYFYLHLLNLDNYEYKSIGASYFQKSINVKSYTILDNNNNSIIQYIISTGKKVNIYRRYISHQTGLKTNFQKLMEFNDYSFNSANTLIDQKKLLSINQSSTLILRNLQIQDSFIVSRSTILLPNSIKVKDSNSQFMINGTLQQLNFDTLQIYKRQNITPTKNQKKIWTKFMNYKIIFNSNKQIFIQRGTQSTSTIINVQDCQVINGYLYVLFQRSQYTLQLTIYDITIGKSIISINIDSNKIIQKKLQMIKDNLKQICLLVYTDINQNIINKFLIYDQQKNMIIKYYNQTSSAFNKIIIPSTTTYFITQIFQQTRTILKFQSINGINILQKRVQKYKWIKVQQTIIIIYLNNNNSQCQIYYFNIDFINNKINIINQQSPTIISLDHTLQQININQIFLLKDQRKQSKLNKYILFYIYNYKSYFYNTLNPIINKKQLKKYNFNSKQQLFIQPQFYNLNLYYMYQNKTIIQIQFSNNSQQPQIYYNCSFQSIFNICLTAKMKILKHQYPIFTFLCQTQTHKILYIFNNSSFIINCNKNMKYLIFQKTIKDYDLNPQGNLGIIYIKNGIQFLEYYQINHQNIIPITIDQLLCSSYNGYYHLVQSNQQVIFYDLLLDSTKILTNNQLLSTYSWSIDNAGIWIVYYEQNTYFFTLQKNFKVYKTIKQRQPIIQIKILNQKLLIVTINSIFYYHLPQMDNKYYLFNNIPKQIQLKYSQNYIAFSINDGGGYLKQITVCSLHLNQNFCSKTIGSILSQTYSRIFDIRNDGKIIIQNDQSDYSHTFTIWDLQLIPCNSKEFISNGQCVQCQDDCEQCLPQTGECINRSTSNTYLVLFIVFLACFFVLLLVLIFFFWKNYKVRTGTLLTEDNTVVQV